MATKKRTKAATGKKTASSSKRRGGKKSRTRKPKVTVTPPGAFTQLVGAPYGWGRIGAAGRRTATQRWKRRALGSGKGASNSAPKTVVLKALPAATVEAMTVHGSSHPLVQAYARAGGTPPGYVRSGPYVGPARPWPKKAKKPKSGKRGPRSPSEGDRGAKLVGAPGGGFGKKTKKKKRKGSAGKKTKTKKKKTVVTPQVVAKTKAKTAKKASKRHGKKKRASRGGRPSGGDFAQKMAAARAAKAEKRAARKRAGKSAKKRGSKKSASKKASTKSLTTAPRAANRKTSRKTGRKRGWPKVGANKRTFGIPKFQAMHKFGVPPNKPIARAKVAELRESAGKGITANQIWNMAKATQMKAWVCAGRVRTGCGGGSKMLKGSHQIGVFGVGRR